MAGVFALSAIQLFLLSTLSRKDRDDGEKGLFSRQRWTGGDAFVLIAWVILFRFLCVYASDLGFVRARFMHRVPAYVPHLVLFLSAWVILRFRTGRRINDFGPRDHCLNVALLSAVPILLCSRIFIAFNLYHGFFVQVDYALTLLVIVPIVEEAIFRGVLYSPYRKKYGAGTAIMATAAIFAAAHNEASIGAYALLFAMGSLFALLYEKKQSLLYPVTAHAILAVPSLLAWSVR